MIPGEKTNSPNSILVFTKNSMQGVIGIMRENREVMVGSTLLLVYVILACLAPYITPYKPSDTNPSEILQPPSMRHWFGTDEVGRDLFTLNIYSIRTSLIVGVSSAILIAIIGLIVGLISGFYGGLIDEILMQIVNFLLAMPSIVLMIVVGAILGPGMLSVIIIIGLVNWSPIARVVRSMVLSLKEWTYIQASKALGASSLWIIRKHILPAITPVVIANTVLSVSTAIFSHAALVFMGVGNIGDWSWGLILYNAYISGSLTSGAWWYFIPPGIMLVALAYAIMSIGYGLEKILNPRASQLKTIS